MDVGIADLDFIIAAVIVFMGLYAVLTRRNLLKIVIGVELMSKGAALAFLTSLTSISEALVILIIGFEVIVTALALAIIVNVYKHYGTLDAGKISKLRG